MFNAAFFSVCVVLLSPPSILFIMLILWLITKNNKKKGIDYLGKQFSEKSKKKIQKTWVLFFWLNALFSLVNIIYYDSISQFILNKKPPFIPYWILGFIFIKIALFIAMYHYIYKKKETNWLLLLIVFVPSGMFIPASEAYKTRIMEGMDFFWAVLWICLLLKIPYWISCIQLYRINSLAKQQESVTLAQK